MTLGPAPSQTASDLHADDLIPLCPRHVLRVAQLRDRIRRGETDLQKYELCVQTRGDLLEEQAEVQLLAYACERAMSEECATYRKTKRAPDDEWKTFLRLAEEGHEINSALKTVARFWGQDVVRHYSWESKGGTYCNQLRSAALKYPIWGVAVIGLNLSMLEREKKSLQHRPIRSPNPIAPRDLAYLRQNPPQEQQVVVAPQGFGFDEYGLLVHEQFATASPDTSIPQGADRPDASVDPPTSASTPKADLQSAAPSEEWQTSQEPAVKATKPPFSERADDAARTSGGQAGAGSAGDTATAPRDPPPVPHCPGRADSLGVLGPTNATIDTVTATYALRRPASGPGALADRADSDADDEQAAPPRRSLRSCQPVAYDGLAATGAGAKPKQTRLPVQGLRHPPECCQGVPRDLLSTLNTPSLFNHEAVRALAPFLPKLCRKHLEEYARRTGAILTEHQPPNEAVDASPNAYPFERRRSASLSDIIEHSPKRSRLDPPLPFSPASVRAGTPASRPVHDRVEDGKYRQRVLDGLRTAKPVRGSHGEGIRRLVLSLLEKAKPPNTANRSGKAEAWFCTTAEAARRVESRSPLDAPLITQNQQAFQWDTGSDPMEQYFQRMGRPEQVVPAQIQSRSSEEDSFEQRRLKEFQGRILSQKNHNDPWNGLDLRCPVPLVLPLFLTGENCQLLPDVRDMVLDGVTAERVAASPRDWNEWKNIESWSLLAEGGNNTGPHTDSNACSTYITCQQGPIGFAWMSHPTEEQQRKWMADPHHYTESEWRFIILKPGQTVFFESGTIHFVFRERGVSTFAIGGHVLRWSAIHRWVQVLYAQLRNPAATNEEMGDTAVKLVRAVEKLVKEDRARARRLCGDDVIKEFEKHAKVSTLHTCKWANANWHLEN